MTVLLHLLLNPGHRCWPLPFNDLNRRHNGVAVEVAFDNDIYFPLDAKNSVW